MAKKAVIVVWLVPEAGKVSNRRLSMDIKKSLSCDWLLKAEKVTVLDVHHAMPSGREVP